MLKVGVFQLIYFTFLHNAEVIAFAVMALTALILLIRRPSRRYVWFFVGFLILAFLFEYQKHIVGDLAEQTVNTLYQNEGNYRLRWLTETVIYHLVPVMMWVGGWGLVGLGMWNPKWGQKKIGTKKKTTEESDLDENKG